MTAPILNEALLEASLSTLEKAMSWSPRSISRLESLIRTADDAALFRINPIAFAAEKGLAEREAIDLFLHSTKAGLFHMEWHLLCPQCSQYVETFSVLKHVQSHYRCGICHEDGTTSLDEYIQISFTISPNVRRLRYHDPESLSFGDYFSRYRWSQGATMPGGVKFLDGAQGLIKIGAYVEPGERKPFDVELTPGIVSGSDLLNRGEFVFMVKGAPAVGLQRRTITLDGRKVEAGPGEIAPGQWVFEIHNRGSARAAVIALNKPEECPTALHLPLTFPAFLTGNRLLLTQTFHDLFASETIKGTTGLAVKSITMLFTDLKGSTALYDRIGDLQAFSLVQQHFDRLGRVVREHSGALVKTIGDAIMASFLNPVDAMKAAISMLQEIDRFNQEHGNREIILKIGIHTGASIAVTLNERIDYFGQTVNIAARVQGLADAGEIYVTGDVYEYPGVQELVRGFKVQAREAHLKGIERGMQVHRVTFDRPTLVSR